MVKKIPVFDPWVKRSPRKGNGTPVFLPRNPVGIGAWQLTVLEVAKSWTQLSSFSLSLSLSLTHTHWIR